MGGLLVCVCMLYNYYLCLVYSRIDLGCCVVVVGLWFVGFLRLWLGFMAGWIFGFGGYCGLLFDLRFGVLGLD